MSENKTAIFCGVEHKIDQRPKRGLWAPGNYSRKCMSCDYEYIGDKRSWLCADCAYPVSKHEKVEWVCTENSVQIKEVGCIHRDDNIMLLVVETGTRYPTVEAVGEDAVFLSTQGGGNDCGATMLSITVPDGFEIWSADPFGTSVRLTVIKTSIVDYTAA